MKIFNSLFRESIEFVFALGAIIYTLFFSTIVFSNELKLPSVAELHSQSDEILLVRIVKGEVNGENEEYIGKILSRFKGEISNKIKFVSTPWNIAVTPNKIGNYYVLHLKRQNEKYFFVNSLNSVIEIEKIDKNRPDLNLILKGRKIDKKVLVTKKGYLYYPALCAEISVVICNSMVAVLKELPEDSFKDIWLPKL